jgi:hypothetical protein
MPAFCAASSTTRPSWRVVIGLTEFWLLFVEGSPHVRNRPFAHSIHAIYSKSRDTVTTSTISRAAGSFIGRFGRVR